jgi:large subunit ribosomal protein L21
MYAVVVTGGKQYRVSVGDKIRVEKLEQEIGKTIELDQVVLVSGENVFEVGKPYLSNAKVIGEVIDQDRAKKILGFKYKRRKKYRKTWGHRQYYTELEIKEIKAN